VRKRFLFVVLVAALSASAGAWVAAHQAVKPAGSTAAPSIDEVLKSVRSDLQSGRSDIVAKNMTLTAEQAAKFWPVFEQYQKEQNAIMDDQLKGIQQYVDSFDKLDDAGALSLVKTHLDRDARMVALRQKWLTDFQKVLPPKLAARAIQIDRRVSLVHQVEFSARIPLIH
jgi:Spy/CpxP family protein refolding chaperone